MSKKKRTRAQKNRAAARRQRRAKAEAEARPKQPAATAGKEIKTSDPTSGPQKVIVANIRPSLVLLMLLIAFQLSLWLVFRLTSLDESLFELIKL